MTLFRSLFEARASIENPTVPISSAAITELLGGAPSAAGVRVNEKTALRIVAVFRCVELIAGTCAALPLKTYRVGTRERVRLELLANPHPELTDFEMWELVYAHLLLWGNAYLRKMRDGSGRVRELWPIEPGRVRVDVIDPTGANPGGKVFAILDKNGVYQPYTNIEILHIPGLGYDGRVGLSRIQLAHQALGTGVAAEEYAGRFFGSGSMPAGILSTDQELEEIQADALKARWRERVAGLGHAHEIAVLDAGAKFQALAIPAKDAQLLETQEWSVTQIARLFGLPPHAIGDVEKSTSWGTGIEQQKIGMVQFTLQPSYLTRVEKRITRDLTAPFGLFAEYAVEGLLRGDSQTRAEFYDKGIKAGWLSRNSVAQKENEESVPGGDEYLLPAGVLPSSVAELKAKIESLGALVRAGFEPAAAAEAVGLPVIAHTGLVPVTVQGEDLAQGDKGVS